MREQEVRELYEAYRQVHQPQEEVEQLDENVQDAVKGALEKGAKFMKTNPVGKAVSAVIAPVGSGRNTPTAKSGGYRPEEVEIDLFDVILEHLIAEGYANTNEAALAIMANMSEEWRQSIVEGGALQNTIKYLEGKRDAMNANKSGSANTAAPGKQSVGAAAYKAYQRLQGV
jgi:hypothetical protein